MQTVIISDEYIFGTNHQKIYRLAELYYIKTLTPLDKGKELFSSVVAHVQEMLKATGQISFSSADFACTVNIALSSHGIWPYDLSLDRKIAESEKLAYQMLNYQEKHHQGWDGFLYVALAKALEKQVNIPKKGE